MNSNTPVCVTVVVFLILSGKCIHVVGASLSTLRVLSTLVAREWKSTTISAN